LSFILSFLLLKLFRTYTRTDVYIFIYVYNGT